MSRTHHTPPNSAATPGAFDHTVVNDTVEEAYQQLKSVVLKVPIYATAHWF